MRPSILQAWKSVGWWVGDLVLEDSQFREIPVLQMQTLTKDSRGTVLVASLFVRKHMLEERVRDVQNLKEEEVLRYVRWEQDMTGGGSNRGNTTEDMVTYFDPIP